MSDPRTDLPAPGAPNFNQRLREVIQTYLGRQGNPLDRGLTIRDLVDTGVLKLRSGFQLKPGAGSSIPLEPGDGVVDIYEPDPTPPPTPGSMTVTASISHVMIEHEAPLYRQGHGHLRTRVYGKVVNAGEQLPTFADAAEIGQFSGTIYAQPSNPATTWRLWTKWETVDGVLSVDPAGGINGLEAVTGQDVALLLEALNGQITSSELYTDLSARIDLIDGPSTLSGSVSQRIATEQIARANEIQAERQARAAALLTEAQARGTAISSETQSRITADLALQSQINMLSAAGSGDFSELLAAIQEEQTARIDGDTAEATQRTTLAAQVTELVAVDEYDALERDILGHGVNVLNTAERIRATASLTEEQTVRATADEALSQRITTLSATVGQNAATLTAEQTARATADEALSSSLLSLTAKVNTNTASITSEQQARATADSALTTSINYLQAQVNGNAASITSEATARANADSSLSTRIDTLTAAVNTADANLSAAIQSEATARANADSAEAQARETLAARVTGAEGSINTQAVQINNRYTKTETDSAISGASQALSAAYKAADAATLSSANAAAEAYAAAKAELARVSSNAYADGVVTAEEQRAIADASAKAEAARVAAVNAAAADATAKANAAKAHADAGILSEQTTRANADSALASSITTLGATVTAGDSQLAAAIQTEATTRATAIQAEAAARQTLQSTVEANNTTLSAAIQTEATTRATQTGELYAQYTVKLDVGGLVSGYGLASSATASHFGIRADRFWISGPAYVSDQPPPSSSLYLGMAWYNTEVKEVAYLTSFNYDQATWMYAGSPETDAAIAALVSPFIVQATPATINGVATPAGVYMRDAFIQNGTITNAKIANLAVDNAKIDNLAVDNAKIANLAVDNAKIADLSAEKITAGTISADRIAANSLTADKIDARGLSIKDGAGNVILAAGTPLQAQYVTPDAGWLNSNLAPSITAAANTATWSGISGAGKPADGATAGSNLIKKATFTDGSMGGWGGSAVCAGCHGGASEIQTNRRDTLENGNQFVVTPGETLYAAGDIWTGGSAYGAAVGAAFLGADGNYIHWQGASKGPSQDWSRVSTPILVPAGAVTAIPWLQIDGPGGQDLPYVSFSRLYLGRQQEGATVGMSEIESSTGLTSVNGWSLNKNGSFKAVGSGNSIQVSPNAASISFTKPDGNAAFFVNESGSALFGGSLTAATGTFAGTLAAGVLDSASFDSIKYVYPNSGNYGVTVPAKKAGWASLSLKVTMVGAGGGGGGGAASGAPNRDPTSSGGGGGAGQKSVYTFNNLSSGAVIPITVGAGGAGGGANTTWNGSSVSGGSGGSGGSSGITVGSNSYYASGGTGGGAGTSALADDFGYYGNGTGGGAGGSLGGSPGSGGFRISAAGGAGGSSEFGNGGGGGSASYRSASAGGAGSIGAGGGGGGADASDAGTGYAGNGGAGGSGYILFEFYDPNTVVLNGRYSALISWLDSIGHGAVPSNAR